MAKKIFIVLGNGFNEHFGLHMSYAAYHDYRKEKFYYLYREIEIFSKGSGLEVDWLLETAKECAYDFTVWDFYFIWPLRVDYDFDKQDVNFELYYYDSFDTGFWSAVVGLLRTNKLPSDEKVLEIASKTFNVWGTTKDEMISLMKRKINFFAQFLEFKYPSVVSKCKNSHSDEKSYPKLYQCIYKELEIFEKQFAEFLEHVQNSSSNETKNETQQSFLQRIKNTIDPQNEFELQIINFNFNKLDDDVTYPCEYVHDTIEKPIFSGSWTNSTEQDDLFGDELKYKYIFDKMYRRRSHHLTLYKDIFNKSDENIIAFYGTSLSIFDASELTLMLGYQSTDYPIYLFYTKYNDDPDFEFNFAYDCYYNFFKQHFKCSSINQY